MRSCEKIRNRIWPVRMTLLENFGAESFHVKLWRSNGNNSERLLPRKVVSRVTTGISKFRKESHPERARKKNRQFFHTFGRVTPFLPFSK
jgi:hypothetical protein